MAHRLHKHTTLTHIQARCSISCLPRTRMCGWDVYAPPPFPVFERYVYAIKESRSHACHTAAPFTLRLRHFYLTFHWLKQRFKVILWDRLQGPPKIAAYGPSLMIKSKFAVRLKWFCNFFAWMKMKTGHSRVDKPNGISRQNLHESCILVECEVLET